MYAPDGSGGLFDLKDQVVIVTGGGRGIGRTYVQRLAEVGARVVAADIDAAAADESAASACATGGRAIGIHVDVSDEASTQAMARSCLDAYGRIDGLVNNAAIMSNLPRRPWFEITVEEWDLVMAVNVRGLFLASRAVWPVMRDQGRGKIINVSSSRVWEGTPLRLHYTASKAAVIGLTRALAREVGAYGITVNAITPGLTLSDTQQAGSDPHYLSSRDAGRALPRPQTPDDLVGTVLYLLSRGSDFLTGQTVNVDGGRTMH